MDEIVYRILQKGDSSIYRKLLLEALLTEPDSYASSHMEESAKGELGFEKLLKAGDKNQIAYGAFKGNDLIALVCLGKEDRIKTSHRAELSSLFVQPAYRNLDIGYELVKRIIEYGFAQFPELESIRLNVIQRNLEARNLYYKLGFVIYGFEKEYLKTEKGYQDMVLMRLDKSTFKSLKA